MTTAIIIGAGVAGPVAAMALQRAGVEATVYERYPQAATDIGAFLTFAVNGMDALRAIDANDVVTGLGFPTPTLVFRSGTGKELGRVPLGGSLADGTVTHTIKRAELYAALHDEALRRGIKVEYGRTLVDARQTADGVTAVFADGTTASADLLIGADGIRSTVRGLIDPRAPQPRYVPVLNVGGYVPAGSIALPIAPGDFEMNFGKRCFVGYTAAPSGEIWWFANPPCRDEPAAAELAEIDWRAELLALFADDRTPAAAIVAATPGPIRAWATYDVPKVPVWHKGSMVVIGDAAHATSPSAGQGASLAIEDAVVLAQCLRDETDVAAACALFESLRRGRVERIVAAGARSSQSKAVGPVGRVVRDALLPLFLKRMAKGDSSAAFMFDHHIDWDAAVAQ